MASKKAVLAIVLAMLCSIQLSSGASQHFVLSSTSTACPVEPCFNLSEYVRNAGQYFTSNTEFSLLEGIHYLDALLTLNNVTNVTLSGVNAAATYIVMSAEAGISCVNSVGITLRSIEIRHGRTSESSAVVCRDSSAVHIAGVKFNHNSPSDKSQALTLTQSTASITDCCFTNGHSKNGGAININSSNVSFYGSNFFESNAADFSGGAVFAHDSVVSFSGNNTFLTNRAGVASLPTEYTTGGGALFASQTVVQFDGFSNFTGNKPIVEDYSLLGGAIMIVKRSSLDIRKSAVFMNNSGYLGAALFSVNSSSCLAGRVDFTNNIATFQGGSVFAYFSNTSFQEDVIFTNNTSGYDGGAVYTQSSILKFVGNVTFISNSAISRRGYGGGVYAADSRVTVSESIDFVENTARRGGGMGFEGASQLVFRSPVTMNFCRNNATQYGGGIYFHDSSTTYGIECRNISIEAKSDCLFKVDAANSSSVNVRLNFVQNYAISATAINGGALDLCRVQVNGVQTDSSGYQFLQNVSTFRDIEETPYISSRPTSVCFCSDGMADCSRGTRTVSIERGRTFNLSLITVGQLNMPGFSRIVGYIDGLAELRPQSYNSERSNTCHDIGFQLFTAEDSEVLNLHPDGCSSANAKVLVSISLKPCPPGFNVTVNGDDCECEQKLKNLAESLDGGVALCDIETGLIRRPSNSTWMKPILDDSNQTYRGLIWYKYCPSTFCKQENDSDPTWLNFSSLDTDNQCAEHRTGIVCGACKENHSLILSSFHCEVCENKYISLLLFFAFAGVGLIAILLALHITVAAGTINGLILYANVVHICRDIFFTHDKTNPLSMFIAWVNLDFGVPTCFYDGLDAYVYIWLQYAFPFYLWLLMGLIIVTSKYSIRVGRLFGSNPVAVLATVILMSYSKILQTTVAALSYRTLAYPDGMKRVWRWDPTLPFLEGKHVFLAIAAICVIIFLLVPYVLLLIFGYRLQAFSGKKGLSWFNKFTPLLDAYYAPFRKMTRFWTGLLLLIRVVLFLSFTISVLNNSDGTLIAVSSLFTTIAIIPWLSSRIYEKLYADMLEASFILNICILSAASYHIRNEHGNQDIVTNVSVGIAFVEFVGIVTFHAYLRVKNKKVVKEIRNWKCLRCMKDALMKLRGNASSNEVKMEPVSTNSFVAFREPLLDDDN